MEVSDPEKTMSHLLTGQLLGVLATQNDGQPYTNLVAFAAVKISSIFFLLHRNLRGNIQI
ncbi:hypothetical protein [Methanohalophilus sp. RSK]|uniref:hypothetical protein n=1 Tax=Methanohalophilus sp. RSK TaxID=2485783 RepID=UPI001F1AD77A|nr:hypothetical protein [Methanohalophilus sp. RSK]